MSKILGKHIPLQPKNLAINGALDYWQEKIAATTTVNTAVGGAAYQADMVLFTHGGTTNKNFSVVQSTVVPTVAQSGFQSRFSTLFTVLTGIASPAAGDFVVPFQYRMEGLDYAKIHNKTVTFSFWAHASIPGSYNFNINNGSGTRSYSTLFTISSPNTYEFKSITVPLDNTSSWNFDNTLAMAINIGTVTGTTFGVGTPNVWSTSGIGLTTAAGATNWQAFTGATLRIAQFSIVEGSLGIGPLGFQRAGDNAAAELLMCQRYFCKTMNIDLPLLGTSQLGESATYVDVNILNAAYIQCGQRWPVTMRATPTVTLYAPITPTAGAIYVSASPRTATAADVGQTGFGAILNTSGVTWNANEAILLHYAADARL